MNWFEGIDQMGTPLVLRNRPKRIISVVPSITEYLWSLGLDHEVVGITKFCVHPRHWYESKQRVGGTKNLHLSVIQGLAPDLIIANKEENTIADIEALRACCPVWVSDVVTIQDAKDMMMAIGNCTGTLASANQLIERLNDLSSSFARLPVVSAIYLMWYEPWMAAANHTYIHHMMELLQLQNCFSHLERYPEINLQMLENLKPNVVLLSSEPFPFKEQHVAMIREVLPNAEIVLTDGELWSWYGSRMVDAFEKLWEWRMQLAKKF